jgi:peptidoglycan/LPS O-acetylase OafA/YrhL
MAKAHRSIAILFILLIPVQVFLAGLNVMGGKSIDPHEGLGHAFELIALILIVLAAIARREALQPSIALLVLVILQSLLVSGDGAVIRALHPVNALVILGVAMLAAAGRPLKPGHHGRGADSAAPA